MGWEVSTEGEGRRRENNTKEVWESHRNRVIFIYLRLHITQMCFCIYIYSLNEVIALRLKILTPRTLDFLTTTKRKKTIIRHKNPSFKLTIRRV